MDTLAKYEPLWLFSILMVEMCAGLFSAYILWIEFLYDKDWNERKAARRKRQMKTEDAFITGEMK